jgi:hypothetical protein
VGNDVSIAYFILPIVGLIPLCLMIWLAVTPLRPFNIQLNGQVLNWDMPETVPNHLVDSVSVL